MKNLFLIDGAAGTGKTDMLEYLREKHSGRNQVAVVRKFTTRIHRASEKEKHLPLDLEFISGERFSELQSNPNFYNYTYGGERYGFLRSDVIEALKMYQHVFVIVRDRAMIQQLVGDFPKVCTIPVFVYTDRQQTEQRLSADGCSAEEIEFRLDRLELAFNDYLKHFEVYREVIINNSNKNDFHRVIDGLIHKYSAARESPDVLSISNCDKFPLPRPLVGFKKGIQAHTGEYDRNVFLMMRFRDNNKLVYDFIKNQLSHKGLNCVRADEPKWNITNNVYNPIAVLYCCKYGIALFDEPEPENYFSPNVAYELGMMHLQGKNCLILRHSSLPAMPFDLIKDLHERYSKDLELERIVQKWVSEIELQDSQ